MTDVGDIQSDLGQALPTSVPTLYELRLTYVLLTQKN